MTPPRHAFSFLELGLKTIFTGPRFVVYSRLGGRGFPDTQRESLSIFVRRGEEKREMHGKGEQLAANFQRGIVWSAGATHNDDYDGLQLHNSMRNANTHTQVVGSASCREEPRGLCSGEGQRQRMGYGNGTTTTTTSAGAGREGMRRGGGAPSSGSTR